MLDDLRIGALIARIRSEVSKAADDVEAVAARSDFEHAWARGYLKGLQRGLDLAKDFLGG